MSEPPAFLKQITRPKRQPSWQACADFTDGQASTTKCDCPFLQSISVISQGQNHKPVCCMERLFCFR